MSQTESILHRTPRWKKILQSDAWHRLLGRKWNEVKLFFPIQGLRFTGWQKNKQGEGQYQNLSWAKTLSQKNSDTVFIFGSGASLNSLTPDEWANIQKHDTLGFNWFNHQNFVDCSFYFVREIIPPYPYNKNPYHWYRQMTKYRNNFQKSHYKNTTFIVQKGWKALDANRLIGLGFLPKNSKMFRFFTKSRGVVEPPETNIDNGLVHGTGTLIEVLNFAYLMGWKRIVLTGIDLYDGRYFWLPPEENRLQNALLNFRHDEPHATVRWLIEFIQYWKPFFDKKGITLEVYNPKSLLNKVLPIYESESHSKVNEKEETRASI